MYQEVLQKEKKGAEYIYFLLMFMPKQIKSDENCEVTLDATEARREKKGQQQQKGALPHVKFLTEVVK